MTSESLSSLGEFAAINKITRDLIMPAAVSVGPGDDGAVFLVNGSAVTSVDMLVEGVHFRRDWCSAEDVGRKTIAVNVADIEAMGAVPVAIVVAAGLPSDLSTTWVKEFFTGLKDEAQLAEIAIIGGDLTSSDKIVVSATAIGQTEGVEPVLRSAAKPGEVVAVRGRLGWAAAGLATLARGFRSPRAAVDAYRRPQVPYRAGRQAALCGASAMVDVSDGLLADLGHIAAASNVTIELDSSRFEIAEPLQTVGQALNQDPLDFVLTGGEDHALAATFPPAQVPDGWQVVGAVSQAETAEILVDGKSYDRRHGWSHFSD